MKRTAAAAGALLDAYTAHLTERGAALGLISPKDVPRVRERHVQDSLRAVACIPDAAQTMIDIGSGAGLPGIPIAIARPDLDVTLLEPARRRIAFLEFVVADLGLTNVRVAAGRAEGFRSTGDVVVVRAVADARTSWRLAEPLLGATGVLVYFAGRTWSSSIAEAVTDLGATATICDDARAGEGGPLVMMRRTSGEASSGGGRDRRG